MLLKILLHIIFIRDWLSLKSSIPSKSFTISEQFYSTNNVDDSRQYFLSLRKIHFRIIFILSNSPRRLRYALFFCPWCVKLKVAAILRDVQCDWWKPYFCRAVSTYTYIFFKRIIWLRRWLNAIDIRCYVFFDMRIIVSFIQIEICTDI